MAQSTIDKAAFSNISGITISTLDDILPNTIGRFSLPYNVSPTGSTVYVNMLCVGTQSSRSILILDDEGDNCYINTYRSNTWHGWKKFTLSNVGG